MKIVGKVICGIISFILCLGICLGMVYVFAGYSIREVYSSEFISGVLERVDFGEIEFIDGSGRTVSLAEMAEEGLALEGVIIDRSNIDNLVRMYSIDDVLAVMLEDWRGWLFDGGAVPVWDAYALADIIVDGMSRDLYEYFAYWGDVRGLFASPISGVLESIDNARIAHIFEPLRIILSGGTLALAASAVLGLALVLFLVLRLRFGWLCMLLGTAGISGGIVFIVGDFLIRWNLGYFAADMGLAKSTVELILLPFLDFIRRGGWIIGLCSAGVFVVGLGITALGKRLRKSGG